MPGPKSNHDSKGPRPDPNGNPRKMNRKVAKRLNDRINGKPDSQNLQSGIDSSGMRPLGNGFMAMYHKPGSQNRKK